MTVLPDQVDASGAGRRLNLTAPSNASEPRVLDEERGALNRRIAVADDEARAFVEGGARSGWLLGACLSEPDERQTGRRWKSSSCASVREVTFSWRVCRLQRP